MPSAPDAALAAGPAPDLWVIEPRQHGVLERVRELWHYRYLWWYFAAQSVTSMYRRTKLGWMWLFLRVTAPVGINSLIFGGLLGVNSSGPPYFLFFVCGSATWILFERSLLVVTRSLEQNRKLVTKVYFPRLILPLSSVAPGLLYLAIMLLVMIVTVFYHRHRSGVWYITLRPELLVSVAAVFFALVFTVAVGLWTSVLQARYRDIRQGLRYFMPFWMYFTPIIYPVTIDTGTVAMAPRAQSDVGRCRGLQVGHAWRRPLDRPWSHHVAGDDRVDAGHRHLVLQSRGNCVDRQVVVSPTEAPKV